MSFANVMSAKGNTLMASSMLHTGLLGNNFLGISTPHLFGLFIIKGIEDHFSTDEIIF